MPVCRYVAAVVVCVVVVVCGCGGGSSGSSDTIPLPTPAPGSGEEKSVGPFQVRTAQGGSLSIFGLAAPENSPYAFVAMFGTEILYLSWSPAPEWFVGRSGWLSGGYQIVRGSRSHLTAKNLSPQTLTSGPPSKHAPRISPDGSTIAFHAVVPDNTPQIFLMGCDGLGMRPFMPSGILKASYPAWSPDGSQLAFQGIEGVRGATWDIWVCGVGSTLPRRVAGAAVHEKFPDWSPDGTQIVYCRHTGGAGQYEFTLRVVDVRSGTVRALPNTLYAVYPRWSPTGRYIAYARLSPDPAEAGIWVYDFVTGDGRRLTDQVVDRSPAWSPAGDTIYFTRGAKLYSIHPDEAPGDETLVRNGWGTSVDIWCASRKPPRVFVGDDDALDYGGNSPPFLWPVMGPVIVSYSPSGYGTVVEVECTEYPRNWGTANEISGTVLATVGHAGNNVVARVTAGSGVVQYVREDQGPGLQPLEYDTLAYIGGAPDDIITSPNDVILGFNPQTGKLSSVTSVVTDIVTPTQAQGAVRRVGDRLVIRGRIIAAYRGGRPDANLARPGATKAILDAVSGELLEVR